VVRVYGFVQDITERQRAEEARRESEERFSAMANNIPQLAWMADETGAICWFNQRWYDYTGATDEEMRGWGWQQVHHPDYVQHVVDTFRQAIQTGQFWEATFPLRGKDGQYRWFLARAVPIRDDRGAVVRWFGTHTDITELRETQQQLRQLTATLEQRVRARTEELARALANEQSARAEAESVRARFQGLFESAPDGIVIVDAEGRIILVNTQLERFAVPIRDDLLGKPVEVLVPARYGDIHVRHRAAYMAAPRTRPMGVGLDLYLRCKDGREVPVEISLSPSATLEGIVVYASIRDITARKAADAEIKRLNEELQHHLARLEMANKELEAFSYSVSHDLRAPLRRIDGFSKILLDKYADRLDETGRDYLARVRNAAVHMGRLIDDMLNLSRVGRREMQRMPVDLSDLAASILAELHQREPERQVRAEVQPGLQVIGDAGLLRIALENLLGNAWKFTGKTPEARIEMGATSQEGARVYYVRDNGAGFDMRYTDKLFSSFQRLHSEEEFPGTGIGLAIVQRIIARHGGRIWAEGEEGKGATFYFTLGEEHP